MGIPQRTRKYKRRLIPEFSDGNESRICIRCIDSDADYKARIRASRTWKSRCAPADVRPEDVRPADVPPALVQKPTSDMTQSNMDNDENIEKSEHEEWIDKKKSLSVDV